MKNPICTAVYLPQFASRLLGATALLLVLPIVLPASAEEPKGTKVPASAQEAKDGKDTKKADAADTPDVVTVTARKQPENLQDLPLSDTVIPRARLENGAVRTVNEASQYVPNVFITEFSARKLSNPRFRGIGSSPLNPGVTTYFDGVPQLNANSSSIELLDIDQIEFVRGPQGALFGRNTVGGLISINSIRPSLSQSSGLLFGTLGNHSMGDLRGTYTAPIIDDKLGIRMGFGYGRRDGFTTNTTTGHTVDDRRGYFGKSQILWKPAANKEVRLLLTGERDNDGDYALNDLTAVRANPFTVTRDFEGFTSRTLTAPTLLFDQKGRKVDFSSISGIVSWRTQDLTDLDYSIAPLATRDNIENDTQFTQEFRLASAKDAPIALSNAWKLRWQAGASYFRQNYDQNAVNTLNPPIPQIPVPNFQSISQASLNDSGYGAYGQVTLTANQKIDFIGGLRGDYENKKARLTSTSNPNFGQPAFVQNLKDNFSAFTPQIGAAYHLTPSRLLYGTVSDGFKAGGFNPASPAGTETYGKEKSRNYEIGLKTSSKNNRVTANLAGYFIDWKNLQLNVPFGQPGQFFISNVGSANSKGVELEVNARARRDVDLFAGAGLMRTRFGAGSVSNGVAVGGNKLPYSPDYTANAGVQYSHELRGQKSFYGRAEGIFYGKYQYDDQNTAAQNSYVLANFRAGVKGAKWFAEGWLRNAFDKNYVPIALPYGFAPSGFIGEPGAPRTFGVTAGFYF